MDTPEIITKADDTSIIITVTTPTSTTRSLIDILAEIDSVTSQKANGLEQDQAFTDRLVYLNNLKDQAISLGVVNPDDN